MQSFIGSWANELAKHFEEVGLLLHTSKEKTPIQDFYIKAKNIKLYDLGPATGSNRLKRAKKIRKVCKQVSVHYDFLLIRGITPRQLLVYQSCSIPNKAYLMVGSIADSKPKLKISMSGLYSWGMYQLRMMQLRQIGKNSLMLANSPRIVEELKKHFNFDALFTPTNTISQNDFQPFHFRPFRRHPEILFVGRVVKDKGIEELITSVGLLKKRDLNCSLRVVGKVDAAYQHQLQNLSKQHSVCRQIHFEGFVPFGDRLLQYYRNSDLYVLPSWHEGFPHSIWEAAASSTPIITTPVGGIPGILSKKEVLFVPLKNAFELANGLFQMLNAPEEAKELAHNAWNHANNFTVEKCAFVTTRILKENAAHSNKTLAKRELKFDS